MTAKSTTRRTWPQGAVAAGFARLIARRAYNALRHEPRLPPPYRRPGFAGSSHDLGRAAAFVGCKDDFGAPNMLLRRVAVSDNRLKPTAISQRDVDDNSCSHDESLNCFGQLGIARMNQTSSYTIEQGGKGVARLQAQGDHRSDVTIL